MENNKTIGEWHYVNCSPADFPAPEPKEIPFWEQGLRAYKKFKDLRVRQDQEEK